MRHELKIHPDYFNDCIEGIKTFELRKNDRNYQVFDELILKEWEEGKYTAREASFHIVYILKNVPEYGLKDGFVILGIE